MRLSRRHFRAGAASLTLGPGRVWAAGRLDLGPVRIDSLSDGHLVLPPDFALAGLP